MKRLRKALCCLLLCALLAGASALPAAALSDVPGDFWAREDIERCVALKYFYPESGGGFGVGKEISRAEFVVVLCRVLGWKPTSPARAVYGDVPETAWYAGAVEAAYHQGAIIGQDGAFRPGEPVTRSEAASMLVRALGYGSIAGLVQDMSLPFQDVRANNGYIVMAYGLGLMDGSGVSDFSPDGHVTREQAASMVMRLHDKLRGSDLSRAGVAFSAENLPDLKGYEAVGVAAAKLAYNGAPQVVPVMDAEEAQAIRAAVFAAGAKPLLYVSGSAYHIREDGAEQLAEALIRAVEAEGYGGLFLDVAGLADETQRDALTAAARLLREKLGQRLLYVAAEAPAWRGAISGYDYAGLGEAADRLVLRFEQKAESAAGQAVIPLEPLEQIYYALNRLRGVVDAGKLTLLLTSTGTARRGRDLVSLTGEELAARLAEGGGHYSGRYACAYLEGEGEDGVWYLNGQAVGERARLARLFGGGCLCLSDLNNALPEVLEGMPQGNSPG